MPAARSVRVLVPTILVALAAATPALGAVTATVDGTGKLTASSNASDAITVTCAAGATKVSGNDPVPATACAAITSIVATSGPQGSPINLAGVTAALFPSMTGSTMTGGPGNDSLTGSPFPDAITGGDSFDTIAPGAGNDVIDPGPDDDQVVFTTAAAPETDTYTPGEGDQLTFSSLGAADAVTVDLSGATTTIAQHANRTVVIPSTALASLVAAAAGGAGNDTLIGNSRSNSLIGNDGNDSLDGRGGSDFFSGGNGNDLLVGGPGDDSYQLQTTAAAETDTIGERAGEGMDRLSLTTSIGVSPVPGATVDLSTAGTAVATWGLTTVLVQNAGEAANLEDVSTHDGPDVVTGNASRNRIFTSQGNDVVAAGPGADTISGNEGDDALAGGPGDDIYQFFDTDDAETDTITELAGEGVDGFRLSGGPPATIDLSTATTTLGTYGTMTIAVAAAGQAANLENLISSTGNDTLTGNAADNVLSAGAGNDRLTGGPGDDTYLFEKATVPETDVVAEEPGGGTDRLDFSVGSDEPRRLFGGGVPLLPDDPLTVDLASTTTALMSSATRTIVTAAAGQAANLEDVVGGVAGDTITGNASSNVLDGGPGDDALAGGQGDDRLLGGTGSDRLAGGPGDDDYVLAPARPFAPETDSIAELPGEGSDLLDLSGLRAGDGATVDLSSASTSLGGTANRTLLAAVAGQGASLEDVRGGPGDDTLTGNGLANVLVGGSGNDLLTGNAGADVLRGGPGDDRLFGTAGDDLLDAGEGRNDLDGGGGNDRLVAGAGDDALRGKVGDDTLDAGDGTNTLDGGPGRDRLRSGSGSDVLSGEGGDDRLDAGAGNDRLTGGRGADALKAGAGDDTLRARDGVRDTVDGGAGRDTATLDAGLDAVRGIERRR